MNTQTKPAHTPTQPTKHWESQRIDCHKAPWEKYSEAAIIGPVSKNDDGECFVMEEARIMLTQRSDIWPNENERRLNLARRLMHMRNSIEALHPPQGEEEFCGWLETVSRAVNSHAALVEALEACLLAFCPKNSKTRFWSNIKETLASSKGVK